MSLSNILATTGGVASLAAVAYSLYLRWKLGKVNHELAEIKENFQMWRDGYIAVVAEADKLRKAIKQRQQKDNEDYEKDMDKFNKVAASSSGSTLADLLRTSLELATDESLPGTGTVHPTKDTDTE